MFVITILIFLLITRKNSKDFHVFIFLILNGSIIAERFY